MLSISQFLSVLRGYATGMIVYHQNNCTDGDRWNLFKTSLKASIDELFEVFDELRHGRWKSLFDELADLWHTIVVLGVRTFLPMNVQTRPWIWYIVFFWAGIKTPWKHGTRYLDHRCIRSAKHCKTKDHVCSNNR